uniref:hypothetical protein n=1 Tax=Thaumasiovibrio occultus TaxID=1891184 RepID=UPI000B35F47A|nr:hypothetical protein [Thaumasiovibrio occultus]
MNKTIIAGAIIAAGAVGGYVAFQGMSGSESGGSVPALKTSNVLEYIPSSTPFLYAQIEPVSTMAMLEQYKNNAVAEELGQEVLDTLRNEFASEGPGAQFVVELLSPFYTNLNNPEQILATTGLADAASYYAYTLGMVPVLKFGIADETAFWQYIDAAQTNSGVTHTVKTLEGVEYRDYPIVDPSEDEKYLSTIVAVKDGVATITFDTNLFETTLPIALEVEKPAESLASTGTLEALEKTYPLAKSGVGYLDFQKIVAALTNPTGSLLGEQLNSIAAEDRGMQSMLENTSVGACQTELDAIAANWPRLVMSYDIDQEARTQQFNMTMESNNQVILNALKSLQGELPAFLDNNEMLASFGIGLNAGNIGTAVTDIVNELQTPSFECFPLAAGQSELSSINGDLAGIHMVTPFVTGVKGFSTGVFGVDVAGDAPSVDGLIVLTAEDPLGVVRMTKGFVGEIAILEESANGNVINLSDSFPTAMFTPAPVYAVTHGNHLAIYQGDKASKAAAKLADGETSNDLIKADVNFGAIMDIVMAEAEKYASPDELEMIKALSNNDVTLDYNLNISAQGITIDGTSTY